jgi:outer membrane receptor protein involved in Fe transport
MKFISRGIAAVWPRHRRNQVDGFIAVMSPAARRHLRRTAAAMGVASLMAGAQLACAADAAPADAARAASPAAPTDESATGASSGGSIAEITITGTHVVRDGYSAPTPVSVITAEEIKVSAPKNIADFVNTLPSIRGSATTDNSGGALSNGESGISALNLRSLGTVRTLVLFDGKRSAPSAVEGIVDINTIPQALISRVEVVTGGASAAYGSGAVGGVVNFILDKKFSGVKTDYQYGESELYGDSTRKFDLTAGTAFAEGRGQVLFSGEVAGENGIHYTSPAWNDTGHFVMRNPDTSAGAPYYLVGNNIGISTYTPGGLITAGPLKGTYFGTGGSVNQLTYGRASGQWMQGGDWKYSTSGMLGTSSLEPTQDRDNAYGRVSFDLTSDTEVFAEASYARYKGLSYYINPTTTGITIQSSNAYLPAAVAQRMAALGLTSFTMGTSNADFPASGSENVRATQRYLAGADGKFTLLGKTVKWDTYGQLGVTNTQEIETPTYNTARLSLATDAVVDPGTGNIVCRSTLTSPANGCVPLDRFGVGVASSQALAYVLGTPRRDQQFKLEEGAVNFSTNDFSGWAGPISLAVGAEGRKESVSGSVDPQYSSGWKYGNYKVTAGSYTVAEGYLETLVPLWNGLDFNGAARYTSYSTSGGVKPWKIGLTYKPIDDVTFRATRSRDIRAANLGELYAVGVARSNSVNINGQSVPFVQSLQGNPNVQPERAITNGFGVVFQPRFVPGFAASIDYYDIKVDGVISFVTAQQVADFCYLNNVQKYCNNLVFGGPGGSLSTINLFYDNLNTLRSKGLDIEASYRVALSDLFNGGVGDLSLRALATHYITNTTNNGVTAINLAGSNEPGGGDTPNWVYRLEAAYKTDSWIFDVVARGVSAGVVNTAYTQCASNCPPSQSPNFTINDNHIAGAIYFDGSITRTFGIGKVESEVFFAVKNLFNKDPPLAVNPDSQAAENTPGYLQTNRDLYDVLGRTFTLGVRFRL